MQLVAVFTLVQPCQIITEVSLAVLRSSLAILRPLSFTLAATPRLLFLLLLVLVLVVVLDVGTDANAAAQDDV